MNVYGGPPFCSGPRSERAALVDDTIGPRDHCAGIRVDVHDRAAGRAAVARDRIDDRPDQRGADRHGAVVAAAVCPAVTGAEADRAELGAGHGRVAGDPARFSAAGDHLLTAEPRRALEGAGHDHGADARDVHLGVRRRLHVLGGRAVHGDHGHVVVDGRVHGGRSVGLAGVGSGGYRCPEPGSPTCRSGSGGCRRTRPS